MSGAARVLRGRIGEHVAKEWAALADNLSVKRGTISEVLSIELLAAAADYPAFGPYQLNVAWIYGQDSEPGTSARAGMAPSGMRGPAGAVAWLVGAIPESTPSTSTARHGNGVPVHARCPNKSYRVDERHTRVR